MSKRTPVLRLNAPQGLDSAGKELWHSAQSTLRKQGTWNDSDGPLLHHYVLAIDIAAKARKVLERTGPESRTADGRPAPHPQVKVARDAEADARAIATALLLTPQSRSRAGVEESKTVEDELSSLIG